MSLYHAAVPTCIQMLGSMVTVLDKSVAYSTAKKVEQTVLVNYRLFPDMRPLSFQIQSLADHASGSCQRCAGIEAVLPARDETTLDQLKTRVTKALDIVKSIPRSAVDAHADQDVVFPMGPRKVTMKGWDYMMYFALPNFWFHHTTAYNIFRHCGVEVGKMDYLGVMPGFPKL